MTRRIGALLLCLVLPIAAACGGGDKKGKTTPTGKTTDGSQSMKDIGDPAAPGGGGGGSPTMPGGGGGSDAAANPDGAGGPVGNTTPPVPEGPPIITPNLDTDPAQAKSAVDQHLSVARSALAAPTPDAETALKEARAALAIDSTSVDAAAMVAFAYYHKKLLDTAELVLDDVFKREVAKKNANIYYVYGLIYDKTNRPAQAELSFAKAVEFNPQLASAWVDVGAHQLQNQQYTQAQATFEKLTQQFNRSDAITLTSLGSAYRGRAAEFPATAPEHDQFVRSADASYKRAIQTNANYGPAYYNLGLLYLDNDPFPGISDALQRINTAKGFFDSYKNAPGFDIKLHTERMKDIDKATKRAIKKAKMSKPPTSAPAPAPTP